MCAYTDILSCDPAIAHSSCLLQHLLDVVDDEFVVSLDLEPVVFPEVPDLPLGDRALQGVFPKLRFITILVVDRDTIFE